jgi:hypothetical protein
LFFQNRPRAVILIAGCLLGLCAITAFVPNAVFVDQRHKGIRHATQLRSQLGQKVKIGVGLRVEQLVSTQCVQSGRFMQGAWDHVVQPFIR